MRTADGPVDTRRIARRSIHNRAYPLERNWLDIISNAPWLLDRWYQSLVVIKEAMAGHE